MVPWRPHENPDELRARLVEVQDELNRVRVAPEDQLMCESRVILSHLRGGPSRVTVDDAIEELATEAQEIKNRLRLVDIDRELHFAHSTTAPFITTTSLHGVPQQAERMQAIGALEADGNRIVSRQVAQGVVDDILEWMLEGWVFGERPSHVQMAGAVTGMGHEGAPLRPYESLSEAARIFTLQGPAARAAAADAARGLVPAVGDPLRNVKAAATLRELDPSAERYPEAHVAAAGVVPEDAARRAQLILMDKMANGEMTEAEAARISIEMAPGGAGEEGKAAGAILVQLPGTPASAALGPHTHGGGSTAGALPGGSSVGRSASAAAAGAVVPAGTAGADAAQMVSYDPEAARRAVASAEARVEALVEAAKGSGDPAAAALAVGAGLGELTGLAGGDGRLAPHQRWMAIQRAVVMRDALRRAVEQRQEVEHAMDETERTLKMAMFIMTLHYFRASVQLKQQRAVWQGSGDADLLNTGPKVVRRTAERERMHAAAEARSKRTEALARVEEMARRGWERIDARRQKEAKRSRDEKAREERKRKARRAAAMRVQKTVRGFLERLRVFRWAKAERERKEAEAARLKGAVDIQRVFRGYLGRQVAAAERKRVAAFVRWLRKQEEKLAVDEFYKNNPLKRWQRDAKNWWRGRRKAAKQHKKRTQRMTDVAETGLETEADREMEALGLDADDRDADSDDSGLEDVDVAGLGGDREFFGAPDPDKPATLKSAQANPKFTPSSKYASLMQAFERRKKAKEDAKAGAGAAVEAAAGVGPGPGGGAAASASASARGREDA